MISRSFLTPALSLLALVLAQRPAVGQEVKSIVENGVVYQKVNDAWTITGASSEGFPTDGIITLQSSIEYDPFGNGEYVMSYDVTSVADKAFQGNSNIKGVTIQEGITSIGSDAFDGCSALPSLTLPSTITSLGKNAFGRGDNLRWVDCRRVTAMADSEWLGNPDHTPDWLGLLDHALLYMPKGCTKDNYGNTNVVFTDNDEVRTCTHFHFPRNKDYCVPWDFTADKVSAYPSLAKDDWAYSVCLPYGQPLPEGASFYTLKSRGADGKMDDVCFEQTDGPLEAGVPYLVVVSDVAELTLQHQGTISIPDTEGAEALLQTVSVNGVTLHGTFRRINYDEASAGNFYVLQTGNLWKRVGGGYTQVGVPPFRTYLTFDDTEASSVYIGLIDDSDTITLPVASPANDSAANAWHTLQGQRLPSVPSQPGIYIHQGKIMVVHR